ncbi:MAG: DUF547 domain-containing protein [Magnetovibrio sp.]|nr:DUF547 domain-containing protein [Magnetovibrio sp.]|tara:strand:+ start:583 stop:1410 length:828 start_codon:yes stop_codon:yes gene_type:complete
MSGFKSWRLAFVSVSLLTLSGFSLFDSFLVPSPRPWEKWQIHNSASLITVDHTAWDNFLVRYVVIGDDGINRVAYARAKKSGKTALHSYLQALRRVHILNLNRTEQKAFWINLYNALTVAMVIEFYPILSIRDINRAWDRKLIRLQGEMLSLNDIEHRILRPIWRDPRIHYSINCAALGCPNIAQQAYTGRDLEVMLVRAARDYINHPRGVSIKENNLILSKIFSWYADDFGGQIGILDHLTRYSSSVLETRLLLSEDIADYVYNWKLNDTIEGR